MHILIQQVLIYCASTIYTQYKHSMTHLNSNQIETHYAGTFIFQETASTTLYCDDSLADTVDTVDTVNSQEGQIFCLTDLCYRSASHV